MVGTLVTLMTLACGLGHDTGSCRDVGLLSSCVSRLVVATKDVVAMLVSDGLICDVMLVATTGGDGRLLNISMVVTLAVVMMMGCSGSLLSSFVVVTLVMVVMRLRVNGCDA